MAAHVDTDKLVKLLSLDIPQVQIALALGCTEGFISQQLQLDDIRSRVSTLRISRLEGTAKHDESLELIENKLIEKLTKSVDYFIKPQEIVNALKVVNGLARKGQVTGNSSSQPLGQVVQVILPNATAINFIRNDRNEIIEADGRSLATLPSHVFKQMAAQHHTQLLPEVSNGDNEAQLAGGFTYPARKNVNPRPAIRTFAAEAA